MDLSSPKRFSQDMAKASLWVGYAFVRNGVLCLVLFLFCWAFVALYVSF